MSEKHEGRGEEPTERPVAPEPVERPAPEPERRAPETEGIGLSIEERGILVAPEVPVPTNKVDIGNMPAADARPTGGGGGGEQGGDQGGGEGAGE